MQIHRVHFGSNFLQTIKDSLSPEINTAIEKYHEEGRNIHKTNKKTHPHVPTFPDFQFLQQEWEYSAYIMCSLLYNRKLYFKNIIDGTTVCSSYSGFINIDKIDTGDFTYYLFECNDPFILVSGGRYNLPFFIYYLNSDILLHLTCGPWGTYYEFVSRDYIKKLLPCILDDLKNRKNINDKIVMFFGNNFTPGHYIWNDTPGVDVLIRTGLIKNIDILVIFHDVFDLHKIILEYHPTCEVIKHENITAVQGNYYGILSGGFILNTTKQLYMKNVKSHELKRKNIVLLMLKENRRNLLDSDKIYANMLNKAVENKVLIPNDTIILFDGLFKEDTEDSIQFNMEHGHKYKKIEQSILDKIHPDFEYTSLLGLPCREVMRYYKSVTCWVSQMGSCSDILIPLVKNGLVIMTEDFNHANPQQCFYIENKFPYEIVYAVKSSCDTKFNDTWKSLNEDELYEKFEKILKKL
jgi:hypothetical protein